MRLDEIIWALRSEYRQKDLRTKPQGTLTMRGLAGQEKSTGTRKVEAEGKPRESPVLESK